MPANPYQFDGSKPANADALNSRFGDIALRLVALEGLSADLEVAKDTLVAIGLQRLNDQLLPTIRLEQARVQRGVLIGASETPVSLVQGTTVNLTIDDQDRLSFSPSAFVTLTRVSTMHDYAVLRTQNWNIDTGLYTGTILIVVGDPGPWNDWQLGSQAASTTAMVSLLTMAQAAQNAAKASADAARADRLLADQDAALAEADRTIIQGAMITGPVLKVAGKGPDGSGNVPLAFGDVSGAAPLNSPGLTGNPAAPTPAAGDNSTRLSTTAFVTAGLTALNSTLSAAIAAIPSFPISGVVAKASAFTIAATDKGKMFDLTGSFTITLPAASGATASAPLYHHFRKRDGSGKVVIACAGSDTFASGMTAISVYQEDVTLVSFGGAWYAPPGGRQRGWVDVGIVTVASAVASVLLSNGFGDPDTTEVSIAATGLQLSAAAYLYGRVSKAGALITTQTYFCETVANTDTIGNPTQSGNAYTQAALTYAQVATGTLIRSAVTLVNPSAAQAQHQHVEFATNLHASTKGLCTGDVTETTAGAIDGFAIFPSTGTITAGMLHQRIYRR